MTPPTFGELGLGPIDRVCHVVRDMEATLPRYEALFGPFDVSAYVCGNRSPKSSSSMRRPFVRYETV
jgi:hypothetical protein